MKALITQRDGMLEHQIILNWADSNHSLISVSCNCLLRSNRKRMGTIYPKQSPWKLYLDPANHVAPFNGHQSTSQVFDV